MGKCGSEGAHIPIARVYNHKGYDPEKNNNDISLLLLAYDAPAEYAIQKRAVIFYGWGFFLISSGSPHVRPMGRTCGEPDEIELTPMGVKLNGSGTRSSGSRPRRSRTRTR